LITPLLYPIKGQEGTLYTFQSTENDLAATFNNSNRKFRFSKFVALDIPKLVNAQQDPNDSTRWVYDTRDFNGSNYFHYDAVEGRYLWADGSSASTSPGNTRHNYRFAEFFQNYVLNAEVLTRSKPDFDHTKLESPAERIFFKALKEVGAIRFEEASPAEFSTDSQAFQNGEKRFLEEKEADSGLSKNWYQRVVKYVGEIDVTNNVMHSDNSFTEVYIHIPNDHGSTPYVMFKSQAVENVYEESFVIPSDTNNPFIAGRDANENPTPELFYEAFYDHRLNPAQSLNQQGTPTLAFKYYEGGIDAPGDPLPTPQNGSRWFQNSNYNIASSGPYAYYTDKEFGDATNDLIYKEWTAPTNIKKEDWYLRSRLDGITIDFNENNYRLFQDRRLESFPELNQTSGSSSFEFNAIAIYYDIYEADNPENFATNLYGVLFLEEPRPSGNTGFKFECFTKYKPAGTRGNRQNGNSYSLKQNLRFDTTQFKSDIVTNVNDYNTFSFDIYMDAAKYLQKATTDINESISEIDSLRTEVETLKDIVLTGETQQDVLNRINKLESFIDANRANFENVSELMSLVERNYQEIINILNNETSAQITYNLDPIRGGRGVVVDRNDNNTIRINNDKEHYSNIEQVKLDTVTGISTTRNIFSLKPFNNYIIHESDIELTATNNIYIYLDDNNQSWSTGQLVRIKIKTPVEFQNNSIILLTENDGNGNYQTNIGVIEPINKSGFFDIICTSKQNLQFDITNYGL
jgi:hypothetical protein